MLCFLMCGVDGREAGLGGEVNSENNWVFFTVIRKLLRGIYWFYKHFIGVVFLLHIDGQMCLK